MCPGSGGWSSPLPGEEEKDAPRFQLYDLGTDISEKHNIINDNPEIAEKMRVILKHHILSGRSTPGPEQKNNGEKIWAAVSWLNE